MKKWIAVAIVFLVVVSALAANHHYIETRMDLWRGMAAKENEFRAPFLADVAALDANPPFPDTPRRANAEPFLRAYVSWEGREMKPVERSAALLADMRAYAEWPKSADVRRRMLADAGFFARHDATWLERISSFDHLDLTSHPALAAELGRLPRQNGIERIGTLAAHPLINYLELRNWGLYYALGKIREGRAPEGLKVLRQIAALMHSSYTLVGAMSAAAMLNSERALVETFSIHGWSPVSTETVDRYRRVSWAWGIYAKAPWYGEWKSELEGHLHPRAGLCPGVNEGIGGPLLLQEWLEPTWPFELDLRAKFAASRDLQRRLFAICDLKLQAAVLDPPPAEANPWILTGKRRYFRTVASDEPEETEDGFEINATKIPYLRRTIGLTIMTIAAPNFMKFYEPPRPPDQGLDAARTKSKVLTEAGKLGK